MYIFKIYVGFNFFFFFLVFTRLYGRDGRNRKKIENTSLIFDFSFLKSICHNLFVQHYFASLNSFVTQLNENQDTGKKIYIFFSYTLFFVLLLYMTAWLFLEYSTQSQISNVKSYPVCKIDTTDPSLKLGLTFEVTQLLYINHMYKSTFSFSFSHFLHAKIFLLYSIITYLNSDLDSDLDSNLSIPSGKSDESWCVSHHCFYYF